MAVDEGSAPPAADLVALRPADPGPRDVSVTIRMSQADKQELLALESMTGWSKTDVVIAGIWALRRAKPFLLSRHDATTLEHLVTAVRGAASNVNTVVRDFHILRNGQAASGRIDAARLETALADLAQQIQEEIVQPIARLLGRRIPPLLLHRPRLGGHVPSTSERLGDRRAARQRREASGGE